MKDFGFHRKVHCSTQFVHRKVSYGAFFLRKQELILIKCHRSGHVGYLGEYIQEFHTTKYALNMKWRHT
jgi:hypothetical protein